MNRNLEQFGMRVMSGEARGVAPTLLRLALRIAAFFYALLMRARNAIFDAGVRSQRRLGRTVISVGNITTGGTGKTPMVQWLAGQLRDAGRHSAILLRGYTKGGATASDEATLLERSLNASGNQPIPMRANPDRISAANVLLREQPAIDLILLDDGFQHRQVARDFDLVLIDATNPFGFGHVLPRGLLREPLTGLRRASAFVITRADQIPAPELQNLRNSLVGHNPAAPIFICRHEIVQFKCGDATRPDGALAGQRIFSFCGIGNPNSFLRQLSAAGATDVGHRWFGDHHAYSAGEVESLAKDALQANADCLVTTEKDWVKIEPFVQLPGIPEIWRAELQVRFEGDDGSELLSRITSLVPYPDESLPAGS